MPTNEKILGFRNRWYVEGLKCAIPIKLPDGPTIRIFPLPYFLASKLEAFLDRGRKDFLASPDMEDIITLADGCLDFVNEVMNAPQQVGSYIKANFISMLNSPRFLENIEGHVLESGRAARVKNLLRQIAGS